MAASSWVALSLLAIVGCGDDGDETESGAFALTSPAFAPGAALPAEYTCTGKNFPFSGTPPVQHTLPELKWSGAPAGTKTLAIVFKDVTLTTPQPPNELGYHWAIWNIPASVSSLPKGLSSGTPAAGSTANDVPGVTGALQFSGPLFANGYVGPCPSWASAPGGTPEGMTPPPPSTDSYTFTLFAFTKDLTVPEPPAAGTQGANGTMDLNYVHVLDDYFITNAAASTALQATSNAQPAMFALPPM